MIQRTSTRTRTGSNRQTAEQDRRVQILNSLLTTPHRELSRVYDAHVEMRDSDPLFYVRLAAWYSMHGEVRDHKEMFVINLVLSDFEGHRQVGLALLRELPPYQVARVVDYIHGRKRTRQLSDRKSQESVKITEEFGLFKNVPRSVKTEVTRYLREREENTEWFDSSVLTARKYLKRLYAVLHIEPSDRAQEILFDEQPPEGSRLAAVKKLRGAKDPTEQAAAIIEHKIPYRVASTVVSAMTPTVMFALVEVMSDQELINNMGSLRKRGVMDNPDLKALIADRLEEAQQGKRVAALKSIEAAKASGVSDDLRVKLEQVADKQVKSQGRIKRSTALLVDKSASMDSSIEVGKRIASLVSTVMDSDLYVYAFDGITYEIPHAATDELVAWEKSFAGIRSGGCTSCGVAIDILRRRGQAVEQIVMVTDESENSSPHFIPALQQYQQEMKVLPHVVFVKVGDYMSETLESQCAQHKIPFDAYQFNGDYYSLPNLVQFLTRPSRLELLLEIMSFPLPDRKAA
ncbi:MAG: hypothetical protein AAF483_02395 [Planctomycetota bacterium]